LPCDYVVALPVLLLLFPVIADLLIHCVVVVVDGVILVCCWTTALLRLLHHTTYCSRAALPPHTTPLRRTVRAPLPAYYAFRLTCHPAYHHYVPHFRAGWVAGCVLFYLPHRFARSAPLRLHLPLHLCMSTPHGCLVPVTTPSPHLLLRFCRCQFLPHHTLPVHGFGHRSHGFCCCCYFTWFPTPLPLLPDICLCLPFPPSFHFCICYPPHYPTWDALYDYHTGAFVRTQCVGDGVPCPLQLTIDTQWCWYC